MATTKISALPELATPEAGDFLLLVDTSAGATKKVDVGNFPVFDADGNIPASVVPRTGTLADLLTVSNAGDGEVATATDIHAQVIYRDDGTGSIVGTPVFIGITAKRAEAYMFGTSIPPYDSSTNPDATPLNLIPNAAIGDSSILQDDGEIPPYKVITLPAEMDSAGLQARVTMVAKFTFAPSLDSGAIIQLVLQSSTDNGTTWSDTAKFEQAAPGAAAFSSNEILTITTYPYNISGSPNIYRPAVRTNNSVTSTVSGLFSLNVEYLGE